ncbi:MAG: sulfatase-like hydrolase/transferase [Planctomycetota bacterium]
MAVLALTLARMESSHGQQPSRNLIMILCDDLGFGDVGINGAPDIETPNMDSLAQSGLTLSRMRSNCTVCSPTRAAILTGLYADRAGVPGVIRTTPSNSWGYLRTDVPTIANRLGDVGYHTAIVGKWHLGLAAPNRPTDRGFHHFHGFLGDMMDDYYDHRRQGEHYMRLGTQKVHPKGHATEIFTRWAMDYLNDRSQKPETPFYLYLAYNAPHFPIQPPPEWLSATTKKHPNAPEKRQANIAFVEHLDHEIGKVLTTLDELGLTENTAIVLTSDNGGSLPHAQRNLPFRDGKQSHYDGGLRVPCYVRIPGITKPGTVNDIAAMTFDLSGTFLDLAGAEVSPDLDCISLLPMIRDGQPLPERDHYFVRREGNARYVGQAYHALIRDGWKLMQNDPFSAVELFNLNEDPTEQVDLAAKQPQRVTALKRAMASQIQAAGHVPWQAGDTAPTAP